MEKMPLLADDACKLMDGDSCFSKGIKPADSSSCLYSCRNRTVEFGLTSTADFEAVCYDATVACPLGAAEVGAAVVAVACLCSALARAIDAEEPEITSDSPKSIRTG